MTIKTVWRGEAQGYETIIEQMPDGEFAVWRRHAIFDRIDDAEFSLGLRTAHEAGEQLVADFSTLPEIIEHAMRTDGATHVLVYGPAGIGHERVGRHGAKLYFPHGDGRYWEAAIWHEHGYWHAQAPSERTITMLPAGAVLIESYLSGASRGTRGRPRPAWAPTQAFREVRDVHGYNIEVYFPDERFARKHESAIGQIVGVPLVTQGPFDRGYRMEWGPIDRDDFRRLEGAIYSSKFGNAVRVNLVQVMYGGGSTLDPHTRGGSTLDPDTRMRARTRRRR